jgi:transposase
VEVDAMEREARRLEGLGQLGFDFRSTEAAPDLAQDQANEADLFLEPEPRGLFVGAQRLNDYLREAGLGWVLKLAALLAELDLSALTCRYQLSGRKAFHPRTLLGLTVYGILNRQWSLRELEALARRDVGAWWLCGGHQPDHSTIGKFIQLHAEVLTEEFFVALVKHLIMRLKLMPGVVAGDGTVVDAAASSYRLLRAEAMLQAAEETQARLAAEPGNWRLRRKAEATCRAAEMASGRAARRLARREAASAVKISPVEPEAVYQSVKGRRPRLCYKPLTLVSEYGLIVAQRVEPSVKSRPLSRCFANMRRSSRARRQRFCSTLALRATLCGPDLLKPELTCSARREESRTRGIGRSDRRARVNSQKGFSATSRNVMLISVPPGVNCATCRSATMGRGDIIASTEGDNAETARCAVNVPIRLAGVR